MKFEPPMGPKRAVVLLSGGLDSATALAVARRDGYDAFALSFSYGQRHALELEAAKCIAEDLGAERHVVLPIDLAAFGGSALTEDLDVPKGRPEAEMAAEIPVTYVPARNTIFLSFALAWSEVLGAGDIFIGVNARDYSGYPDCRPEYIRAFQSMANLATKGAVEGTLPVRLQTPLIDMSKAEIIRLGTELGVDYALTLSCYDPDDKGRSCGGCDACILRRRGFQEAGVADPTVYQG